MINLTTLSDIHNHVQHARAKHLWPESMPDAEKYRIAEREIHEMATAMLKGDRRGVRKEALDAIAMPVRLVEGEGE